MTETYKPKKKTKGLDLKKGQRLQVTTGKPAVLSAPAKGTPLSKQKLQQLNQILGPYSDKFKAKAKLKGQVARRSAKRFSRTSQGRQSALLLLGGGLTALLKKLQDAKESNQKEVKVGGARFTIEPTKIDPVAEYRTQSDKKIKLAQDRIHGR